MGSLRFLSDRRFPVGSIPSANFLQSGSAHPEPPASALLGHQRTERRAPPLSNGKTLAQSLLEGPGPLVLRHSKYERGEVEVKRSG